MSPKNEFPQDPFAPEGQITPEIVPLEHEQEIERTPIAIIDSVLRRINEDGWDDEEDEEPKPPTIH
jgi:hypothetical protein